MYALARQSPIRRGNRNFCIVLFNKTRAHVNLHYNQGPLFDCLIQSARVHDRNECHAIESSCAHINIFHRNIRLHVDYVFLPLLTSSLQVEKRVVALMRNQSCARDARNSLQNQLGKCDLLRVE